MPLGFSSAFPSVILPRMLVRVSSHPEGGEGWQPSARLGELCSSPALTCSEASCPFPRMEGRRWAGGGPTCTTAEISPAVRTEKWWPGATRAWQPTSPFDPLKVTIKTLLRGGRGASNPAQPRLDSGSAMASFNLCMARRVLARSQMGLFFPKGARILSCVKISMSLPSHTSCSLLGLERPRALV